MFVPAFRVICPFICLTGQLKIQRTISFEKDVHAIIVSKEQTNRLKKKLNNAAKKMAVFSEIKID